MDSSEVHFRNLAIELAHCIPGVLERVLFSGRNIFIDLLDLVDVVVVEVF